MSVAKLSYQSRCSRYSWITVFDVYPSKFYIHKVLFRNAVKKFQEFKWLWQFTWPIFVGSCSISLIAIIHVGVFDLKVAARFQFPNSSWYEIPFVCFFVNLMLLFLSLITHGSYFSGYSVLNALNSRISVFAYSMLLLWLLRRSTVWRIFCFYWCLILS